MKGQDAKVLMVQGTTSHAGKTILVAALCRILSERGYKVAPFKAQNMSLNSYVTNEGAEIARAQALQAFAAGIEPKAEMNPILLKPKGEKTSQVVLHGKPYADVKTTSYSEFTRKRGAEAVKHSLSVLLSEFDVVVIEGAGSPAEINLYDRDITNMYVADLSDAPVFLIADIDRGGVFASMVGTLNLLKAEHRKRVKGLIINKFRGEYSILQPGLKMLEEITSKPVLGVIPYINDLDLPMEDSVSLEEISAKKQEMDIAIIQIPLISNFTDFDPLRASRIGVRYVKKVKEMGKPDAVILPGTKNSINALSWIRKNGFDRELLSLRKHKVPIIGICGGFQILGKKIEDPMGIEDSKRAGFEGLGFLDMVTKFEKYDKVTKRVNAAIIGNGPVLRRGRNRSIKGYEIHMGMSEVVSDGPLFRISSNEGDHFDGAISKDGLVFGSYLHGMFDDKWLREGLIGFLAGKRGIEAPILSGNVTDEWDRSLGLLTSTLRDCLDLERIFKISIS
ncbi:MAG: cobyric acid synthase [Nitrososphaerales archaeon]